MKILVCVALTSILCWGLACDDNNTVPPAVQQAAEKAQAQGPKGPPRPTTQELLTGGRRRFALSPLPFSVSVPTSWKVDSLGAGSITVLAGPTPSGEAQIQLSTRSVAKKDELEIIQRAAKKELTQPATDSTKRTIKADFRKLGEVELFERQAVGQPSPLTLTNPDGSERVETATPYTWTLMMFVPQGNDFARHEMNFIGLTAEQFQQDKGLLEGMLASLQYDPGNAPVMPTTQP